MEDIVFFEDVAFKFLAQVFPQLNSPCLEIIKAMLSGTMRKLVQLLLHDTQGCGIHRGGVAWLSS